MSYVNVISKKFINYFNTDHRSIFLQYECGYMVTHKPRYSNLTKLHSPLQNMF